ncbi:MAG: sporulation protein [Lachnospiraceae bacterium]|nr:sporulation protein [Lachnospiraceae bacterium]
MSKENNFNQTVDTLFQGMDGFISTKTIVGEPINVNGVLIIPLADVQFGVGAGAFASQDGKSNAGGGLTGKVSPSAVLVIQNGNAKLVNVKNQDTVVKILDMIPDLIPEIVDKVTALIKGKDQEKAESEEAVKSAVEELSKGTDVEVVE